MKGFIFILSFFLIGLTLDVSFADSCEKKKSDNVCYVQSAEFLDCAFNFDITPLFAEAVEYINIKPTWKYLKPAKPNLAADDGGTVNRNFKLARSNLSARSNC